jgi:hypothetical protein
LVFHARSRPPPPWPASESARHFLSAFAPDPQVSEISFFSTPCTSRNCNTPIRIEKEDEKFLEYAHIITAEAAAGFLSLSFWVMQQLLLKTINCFKYVLILKFNRSLAT